MKLTISELSQLTELITSCVNTITCMSLFKNQVKDAELKSILETQFPLHIQDYNMKVKFVKEATAPTEKLTVPTLKIANLSELEGINPVPVTVNTNAQAFNDREIATSYLLTLKRAGREYAWVAMEASNPDLREFLKDAFTLSCNHAYEVWQWMAKRGFYPCNTATEQQINTVGSIFNVIQ